MQEKSKITTVPVTVMQQNKTVVDKWCSNIHDCTRFLSHSEIALVGQNIIPEEVQLILFKTNRKLQLQFKTPLTVSHF